MNNWGKYIFEDNQKTILETNDFAIMHNFLEDFQLFNDKLIFQNVYESMNYYTIHFAGYNLMIKK